MVNHCKVFDAVRLALIRIALKKVRMDNCQGCVCNSPGQMAHMDLDGFGCLSEPTEVVFEACCETVNLYDVEQLVTLVVSTMPQEFPDDPSYTLRTPPEMLHLFLEDDHELFPRDLIRRIQCMREQ